MILVDVGKRADAALKLQPERAGRLTNDEIRELPKPLFKDPDLLERTITFVVNNGDKFPIPDFSVEEVLGWQERIQEINELEPQLEEMLQILRQGRLIFNGKFWALVFKIYNYLKVMKDDHPALWEEGSFLEDLFKERAKRSKETTPTTEQPT